MTFKKEREKLLAEVAKRVPEVPALDDNDLTSPELRKQVLGEAAKWGAALVLEELRGDIERSLDVLGMHQVRPDVGGLFPTQDLAMLYKLKVESTCRNCGEDHIGGDVPLCTPSARNDYIWRYVTPRTEGP